MPVLVFGVAMVVAALVLIASVVELVRLRNPQQPRTRRRRSRLSLRRVRIRASESLRRRMGTPV